MGWIFSYFVHPHYLREGKSTEFLKQISFLRLFCNSLFVFVRYDYFLWIWSSPLNVQKISDVSKISKCILKTSFMNQVNCWKKAAISVYSCWHSPITEFSSLGYIRYCNTCISWVERKGIHRRILSTQKCNLCIRL